MDLRVGDLVRRKGKTTGGWYAIVIAIKDSGGYLYPSFVCLDDGGEWGVQSCSASLFEIVAHAPEREIEKS